jgi:hypothetical protein
LLFYIKFKNSDDFFIAVLFCVCGQKSLFNFGSGYTLQSYHHLLSKNRPIKKN